MKQEHYYTLGEYQKLLVYIPRIQHEPISLKETQTSKKHICSPSTTDLPR